VRRLLLARHAESRGNVDDALNGVPPGPGLSAAGEEQARALGRAVAHEPVGAGAVTRFRRARETAELALAGRGVPLLVVPELDEIGYGAYEGRSLDAYRAWAWTAGAGAVGPGGGESRAAVAARVAAGLERLLGREEEVVLAVSHALTVRYTLEAAAGRVPAARIEPVPHAAVVSLGADEVRRAAGVLAAWSRDPVFAPPPGVPGRALDGAAG
jgi:probable phosphoglycerate mutase